MKFVVAGAAAYKVGVAAEALEHEGKPVLGVWDETAREIRVSPHVPPKGRLDVVLHELAHAWLAHAPPPVQLRQEDVEPLCDWLATFAAATYRGLAINGGAAALLRLRAGESPQPGAARVTLSAGRSCGRCTQSVAAGSVEARADGEGGVRLALWCGFCEHLQVWTERADAVGNPTGEVVGGAEGVRLLRSGPEVLAHRAMHPEG